MSELSDRPRRRGRLVVLLLVTLASVFGFWSAAAQASPGDEQAPAVLYFFWGEGCPHCAAAKPVLADLEARYPALEVRDYEVYSSPENRALFVAMAESQGFEASGVPTFVLGDRHWVGFSPDRTGPDIERQVVVCLAEGCTDAGAALVEGEAGASPPAPAPSSPPRAETDIVDLPLVGEVDLGRHSLLLTTALIALVDGVNPCSLWVLTILLALALRSGSRRLTILIGLVFITVSALMYALFIAGVFSLLTVLTVAGWVRVLVALVAAAFAAVNIKDYFWFRRGLSLTIPDRRKPGIYARTRRVMASTESIPALVASTAALAAGVSVVELACTAGFPVLWSNLLTANDVGPAAFAGLLGVYMLIYQLDELLIFGVAVVTLRASKLQERHGRVLKLVSGLLMLSLAVVMVVDPALMSTVAGSLAVFGIALGATVLVVLVVLVDQGLLPRLRRRLRPTDRAG